MTTDLWVLVAAAFLQWLLIIAAAVPKMLSFGMSWALGNRGEDVGPSPEWVQRVGRASENMKENLILFAIVVLVVHVAGKAGGASATGAMIFIGARIAHAIIYIIGIPGLRTLAWLVGVVGMFIVASALL